jgi:hypothetical protein
VGILQQRLDLETDLWREEFSRADGKMTWYAPHKIRTEGGQVNAQQTLQQGDSMIPGAPEIQTGNQDPDKLKPMKPLNKPVIQMQPVEEEEEMLQTQPVMQPMIQRAIIRDARLNPIAYEFRIGTELDAAFVSTARGVTRDGTVNDADLRRLRSMALRNRGTLNDHERMFMAGLLDPANVRAFNGTPAGANFRFPLSSITAARRNHVNNLDRTIPANVQREMTDVVNAVSSGNPAAISQQNIELQRVAIPAIRQLAGSNRTAANRLITYINANSIQAGLTVTAMVRAASDNSSGDRVMAGTVYAIAQQASHPMTNNLLNGRIKVDSIASSAMRRLPGFTGREEAGYMTVAVATGLKGDTMYVKSSLDITNFYHRTVVIHELRHAQEDAGASATGRPRFVPLNQMESRAYRAQAAYIYDQLHATPANRRSAATAQIAAGMNDAVLVALFLEGRRNTRRNTPLYRLINAHFSGRRRLQPSQIPGAFAIPAARLEARLIATINRIYRITNTTEGGVDGLGGESLLDWLNRL